MPEFIYAISVNKCPACGKCIMQKAKLAAFLGLRELLDNYISVKDVNIDKLASLIMANFEIKQLFNNNSESQVVEQPNDEENYGQDVNVEEESEDTDYEFKTKQLAEAKEILKKMRDEALSGAVKDRYGFGDEDSVLLDDGDTHELMNKKLQQHRQDIILSRSGGKNSFHRSE
jgi:hypothetical protein